jgi:hypothetical protein
MSYQGRWGLIYDNKEEEQHFVQTRRLNGFHISVVKEYYDEKAYQNIMGSNWNEPEPKGRGRVGTWGMDLRYAPLDKWYMAEAVKSERFTEDEVENFWAAWKPMCHVKKPLTDQELLDHWRANRKSRAEAKRTNRRKKTVRRTKAWQEKFQAERDPALIYRRLKATLQAYSTMDEQLLRSFARYLAEANDLLWQAEQLKDDDGVVPEERLGDYAKVMTLSNKLQKQITDLLKAHGYDYQARRSRREAQTAAEVFDEFVGQAAVLFDQRAVEFICENCKLSIAYVVRQFPTVEFTLSTSACPRCNHPIERVWEAAPDEVMDA